MSGRFGARTLLIALLTTATAFAGCIGEADDAIGPQDTDAAGADTAAPSEAWPESEPIALAMAGPAPEACALQAFHPAIWQGVNIPTIAYAPIPKAPVNATFTLEFHEAEALADYHFIIEHPDGFIVGSGNPSSGVAGDLPAGAAHLWVWHCAGGAGAADFTVAGASAAPACGVTCVRGLV